MLINADIIFRHAQDASFFWVRRTHELQQNELSHDLRVELDGRIDANLDGLIIAGSAGIDAAAELREAYSEPGELFVCSVLAAYSGAEEPFSRLCSEAVTTGDRAALISALGWHEFPRIEPLLRQLVASPDPALVLVGLGGYGVHRQAPERALQAFFGHDDREVAERALRCAGELGRVDLAPAMRGLLGGGLGRAAALALSLLGVDEDGVRAQLRAAAAEALAPASFLVNLDPVRARDEIQEFIRQRAEPQAIRAIGALGDCAFIPLLIEWMDDERLAALANDAFVTLTGLSPSDDRDAPEPAPDEDDEQLAPEAPSSADAAECWREHQARFHSNVRYIAGQPLGGLRDRLGPEQLTVLDALVRRARPLERVLAASRVASLAPVLPLPEVRAFASPGHDLPGAPNFSSDAR